MPDLNQIIEREQYSEQTIFLNGTTAATKSEVKRLPSRLPIAFDVVISGTATVNIYASNIETDAAGTKWGAPVKSFTASGKVIMEKEPWVNWMVEHASGTGTVFVASGV